MSTTTKPIIRTTDPNTGKPNPTAHVMEPTPTYLHAMARLIAVIDKAYNEYWLRGKTPGLFDAKALFGDLMTAYGEVVKAGEWIGARARGPVTPDPSPKSDPQPPTSGEES